MRVISGKYKGYRFKELETNLVRPTTDMAREALFNHLEHLINTEEVHVLDLFAGSGSVSLEFLSRNCQAVQSIDNLSKSTKYLNRVKKELEVENWDIVQADAFQYIHDTDIKFDLIFADPPYHLPQIHKLVDDLMDTSGPLVKGGICILEHFPNLILNHSASRYTKTYGRSEFTFLEK